MSAVRPTLQQQRAKQEIGWIKICIQSILEKLYVSKITETLGDFVLITCISLHIAFLSELKNKIEIIQ